MCVVVLLLTLQCYQHVVRCVRAQIRKDYYDENIKAGPQSRILEGVTWEEAQKIRVCCGCQSADAVHSSQYLPL